MFYTDIAKIYAQSRPPYPQELFDLLIKQVPGEERDFYLDLGCGTGELLLPLSKYFKKNLGIDPDKDMLQEASAKISTLGIPHVDLINSTAEDYLIHLPQNTILNLVTAGRSFHWMKQEMVAREIYKRLSTNGVFAILGEANGGIWKRQTPWAQAIHEIIFKKLSHKPLFMPAKGHSTSIEIVRDNLAKVPFSKKKEFLIEAQQIWNLPTIINLFYSGSGFLDWLGKDKELFETMATEALLALQSSETFEETSIFGVTICIK